MSTPDKNQSNLNILINADDAQMALKDLHQFSKSVNSRISLQWVTARAQISSKGNLSDMLNGRRPIPLKSAMALAKAYGLTVNEAKYFTMLVERGRAKTKPSKRVIESKMEKLKSRLLAPRVSTPRTSVNPMMIVLLFCALDLFREKPRLMEIANLLKIDLQTAKVNLECLIELNLVHYDGERYCLLSNQFQFSPHVNRIDFFYEGLIYAQDALKKYFGQPDRAYFSTNMISIKKDDYKSFLDHVRSFSEETASTMESLGAESLVLMNLQLFPVHN